MCDTNYIMDCYYICLDAYMHVPIVQEDVYIRMN